MTTTASPPRRDLSRSVEGYPVFLSDRMTVSDVEKRVMRACKTVRSIPDKEAGFLRRGGPASMSWHVVHDFWDAYSPDEIVKIKFRPTPFDVSDMLKALGWCRCLTKQEFKLIWWRSFEQVSFSVIAARIGRSDETARARYRDALLKVWHVANT
jgi:hypothetical protein